MSIVKILQLDNADDIENLLTKKILENTTYSEYYLHLSVQDSDQVDTGYKLYTILEERKIVRFSLIINNILCYLGVLKSEFPLPSHIDITRLLDFLIKLVDRCDIHIQHIQTFVYFLIKPSCELSKHHHEARIELVTTCFRKEMDILRQSQTTLEMTNSAFQKISKYLVHLDKERCKQLTSEHVKTNITRENFNTFVVGVFMYMGLLKSEEPTPTSNNLSAPLYLLDFILEDYKELPKSSYDILEAFLSDKLSWKYTFCNAKRKKLYYKLQSINKKEM